MSGATPTDRRYTGQRAEGTGLVDYGTRFYDPALGRWVQPDTLIPDPANFLDFDRYSYTRNNSIRYTDPSGHMIDEGNDSGFDSTCHDRTRQNRIFSLIFRGSGENGAWSGRDWKYYYNNRNELWNGESVWINPDSESGWDLFSLHVERLTANYSPDQSDQFMSALPQ